MTGRGQKNDLETAALAPPESIARRYSYILARRLEQYGRTISRRRTMTQPLTIQHGSDGTERTIGKLAEWALIERRKHLDPWSPTGGTWLGAISFPLFEGISIEDTLDIAEAVRADLDAPHPGEYLVDDMAESYGVGAEWGSDHGMELAEAAATIAAAVYDRLGVQIPERAEDDSRTAIRQDGNAPIQSGE